MKRFYSDLWAMLRLPDDRFDLEAALYLSQQIHDAEEDGYEVTSGEETLWSELTIRIERTKV